MGRGFLCGTREKEGWGKTARCKSDDFAQGLYFRETDFAVVSAVEKVAADKGVEPAQIALAWLLHKQGVTSVIIGARKEEQLIDDIHKKLKLSEEDVKYELQERRLRQEQQQYLQEAP